MSEKVLTVGLICPGGGEPNPENEMRKCEPENFNIVSERLPLAKISVDVISEFANHADAAAAALKEKGAEIVALNCTAGSFIRGKGYDEEITARLEKATGLPATTTTSAVLAALSALGIKTMTMITPYPDSVNEIEKRFMEDHGFKVSSYHGLGIEQMNLVAKQPFDRIYRAVADALDPNCDGIFISCAGFKVCDYIRGMEHDFGKPVVTSNQATLWMLLRMMGRKDRLMAGSLFER